MQEAPDNDEAPAQKEALIKEAIADIVAKMSVEVMGSLLAIAPSKQKEEEIPEDELRTLTVNLIMKEEIGGIQGCLDCILQLTSDDINKLPKSYKEKKVATGDFDILHKLCAFGIPAGIIEEGSRHWAWEWACQNNLVDADAEKDPTECLHMGCVEQSTETTEALQQKIDAPLVSRGGFYCEHWDTHETFMNRFMNKLAERHMECSRLALVSYLEEHLQEEPDPRNAISVLLGHVDASPDCPHVVEDLNRLFESAVAVSKNARFYITSFRDGACSVVSGNKKFSEPLRQAVELAGRLERLHQTFKGSLAKWSFQEVLLGVLQQRKFGLALTNVKLDALRFKGQVGQRHFFQQATKEDRLLLREAMIELLPEWRGDAGFHAPATPEDALPTEAEWKITVMRMLATEKQLGRLFPLTIWVEERDPVYINCHCPLYTLDDVREAIDTLGLYQSDDDDVAALLKLRALRVFSDDQLSPPVVHLVDLLREFTVAELPNDVVKREELRNKVVVMYK